MSLPSGISLTTITFGSAVTNVSRNPLSMRVSFTPTSNLVWAATGTVIIGLNEADSSGVDGTGSIDLIDPWQPGFVDGAGNSIINWGYRTVANYLDAGGNTVLTTPEKVVTWTQADDGPLDLDLLVPIPAASGIVVYLPDTWSGAIAALTARVANLENAGSGGGGGGIFQLDTDGIPYFGGGTTSTGGGTTTPGGGTTSPGGGTTTPTGSYLLTESGNRLTTESGNLLTL